MRDVGLLAALGAGILSFLSPCVLPLIPGYLSFISGYGLARIREGSGRLRILTRSLAFAAGFSLVFVALSMVFSSGALLLGGFSKTLTLVAGVVVGLLGLNLVFDFIKVLNLEARFHPGKAPASFAGAFLLGIAFAAGWSPCVGPILASILLYAGRTGSLGRSAILLGAYSLGLALPFMAAGLFFGRLGPLMNAFKRHARAVRLVSGLLLLTIGAGMALGRLGALSSLGSRAGMGIKETFLTSPWTLRYAAAGLWLLAAVLVLALPALRGRKAFTPPRLAAVAVLGLLAAGELAGLWSTARLVAQWLSFQGA